MSINFISLTQIILVTILGAFLGNLFSIFIDRRFFSELSETPNKLEILEAILASVKISLSIGAVSFIFACIDTLLALNSIDIVVNSINIKFIANMNLPSAFGFSFFVVIATAIVIKVEQSQTKS